MITFRGQSVHSVEKIFDFTVAYKGLSLPVGVYLVEETVCQYFYHCVCCEGTRHDWFISIDKRENGEWYDLGDRNDQLAVLIGSKMDELEVSRVSANRACA